jgi:hypothetical protein
MCHDARENVLASVRAAIAALKTALAPLQKEKGEPEGTPVTRNSVIV